MLRNLLILLTSAALLTLAGCLTFEVGLERPTIPDQDAVGTLASLMVEGTRWAYHVTQVALPPTPTPQTALVQGKICYPGQAVPAMQLYFRRLEDERLEQISTAENQEFYSLELPPGQYYAYAWVERYQVGGLYSRAVTCGLLETCTDHNPQSFEVEAGQVLMSVDLCDWVFSREQLPTPPGQPLDDDRQNR